MRTEVILITPELAKEYLEKARQNRNTNKHTVNFYADEMLRGQWKLTGQGLSFGKNGKLLDGQHRLKAIIKANTAIELLVIHDVEESSFSVYDSGKTRTAADIFAIEGIPNNVQLATIIIKYIKMVKGHKFGSHEINSKVMKITKEDSLQEYKNDSDSWQQIVTFAATIYRKYRFYSISDVGSITAYLIKDKKHSQTKVINFFLELVELAPSRPTLTNLRSTLIKNMTNRVLDNSDKRQLAIFLIRAWNSYITDHDRKQFTHTIVNSADDIPAFL